MFILLLIAIFAFEAVYNPLVKRQAGTPSPRNSCYNIYQLGYSYGFYDGYYYVIGAGRKKKRDVTGSTIPGLQTINGKTDFSGFPAYTGGTPITSGNPIVAK